MVYLNTGATSPLTFSTQAVLFSLKSTAKKSPCDSGNCQVAIISSIDISMAKVVYTKTICLYDNHEKGVSVYQAVRIPGNNLVAIKEITGKSIVTINAAVQEALNQAKLYMMEGVVKVYECRVEEREGGVGVSIVQELMDTDLDKEIRRRKAGDERWSEGELLSMLKDLLHVLSTAQSLDISHRDLKPHNLYLHSSHIKLGDFGSSSISTFESLKTTIQGSPFFLSPELKQSYMQFIVQPDVLLAYDPFKSDVYSLGLTFANMVTLEAPGELARVEGLEEGTEEYIREIRTGDGVIKEVLRDMLQVKPENRPSFQELLMKLENLPMFPYVKPVSVPGKHRKKHNKPPTQCLTCQRAIEQTYNVRDVALREAFGRVKTFFCSEHCLHNFSIVCVHSHCLHCHTSMLPSSHPVHLLHKNFVLLPCGHMFHTSTCFHRYLTSLPSPSKAVCSVCDTLIDMEVLKKYVGKRRLQQALTLTNDVKTQEVPNFTKSVSHVS